MFIKVDKKVINTSNIRIITIHQDEKHMGIGEPKNYVMIYFTEEDHEKLNFESSDEIKKFLNLINVIHF